MKKITLSLFFFFIISGLTAQETHHIDWRIGSSNADLIIAVGDTVIWTWGDDLPHTVTSLPGSTNVFDSGSVTGIGKTFSHTFNNTGNTDYQCNFHPGTMFGKITVETLSIEDEDQAKLSVYPNPVTDILIIKSPETITKTSIFNILGKEVLHKKHNSDQIQIRISNLNNGLYFIKVEGTNSNQVYKFIKK